MCLANHKMMHISPDSNSILERVKACLLGEIFAARRQDRIPAQRPADARQIRRTES